MSRRMYDSVTASNIPTNAQIVAGYIDGRYAWTAADWARFPNARKVHIAVFATTNAGEVLDVEQGDATPTEVPQWVINRRHAGIDPTIYCSLAMWPMVQAQVKAWNLPQPHYWIADWNDEFAPITGAVAHQYQNLPQYDLSYVEDYWPGIDPSPFSGGSTNIAPPPVIPPTGGTSQEVSVRVSDLQNLIAACNQLQNFVRTIATQLKL